MYLTRPESGRTGIPLPFFFFPFLAGTLEQRFFFFYYEIKIPWDGDFTLINTKINSRIILVSRTPAKYNSHNRHCKITVDNYFSGIPLSLNKFWLSSMGTFTGYSSTVCTLLLSVRSICFFKTYFSIPEFHTLWPFWPCKVCHDFFIVWKNFRRTNVRWTNVR